MIINWNYCDESIDDTLYEIGLCLTSIRDKPEPKRLANKPIIIFIFHIVYLLQRIASISYDNENTLLILGDTGRYFNVKVEWNLMFSLVTLTLIASQLNYYYNYKIANKPTFIGVLQKFPISKNSVKPYRQNLGLFDQLDRNRIINLKKAIFFVKMHNNYLASIVTVIVYLPVYILNERFINIILYGIPHTLMMSYLIYLLANFMLLQYLFFNIICLYLKSKLKYLNLKTLDIHKTNIVTRVTRILYSYDALYREIDEYNASYWSKYLFIIGSSLGTTIVMAIYVVLFNSLEIAVKIAIIYLILIASSLLNATYSMASSLNSSANKSYKIFHSIVASFSISKRISRVFRIHHIIKVLIPIIKYGN